MKKKSKGFFTKEEWENLPLTIKTARTMDPFIGKDKFNTETLVESVFHSTNKYSSDPIYKPVSSLFYEND